MNRRPLLWGFYFIGLVSVLYEPIRTSLHNLGQGVGGVGGVGGLTNQWGPVANCTTTVGGASAPWCFQPGWLGYTPFAGVMLALLTAPLVAASLASHFTSCASDSRVPAPRSDEGTTSVLLLVWFSASTLWFTVPLAAYLASPFFQTDVWHVICAVAICAAFPLSWHLSFVAIPASAAPFLVPILRVPHSMLKVLHVRVAWATVGWAALHALGEVVYLLSQKSFASSLSLTGPDASWDDSLLFIFGLVTALTFIAHAALAALRKNPAIKSTFRRNHRVLAAFLLLSASAHWWPFVFFLLPAIACTATGFAAPTSFNPSEGPSGAQLALASAVVAAVLGLTIVWALRQEFMLKHPGNVHTPFLFPPTCVGLSFAFAYAAAKAAFRISKRREADGCRSDAIAVDDDDADSVELAPLMKDGGKPVALRYE